MTEHPGKNRLRFSVVMVFALIMGFWSQVDSAVAGEVRRYAYEDVKIAGKTLHACKEGSKPVSVVLGQFRLEMGRMVLTGDNAVIWIDETPVARAVLRKITVYVEGRAKIVRQDGSTMSDCVMMVTIRHQGQFSADSRMQLVAGPAKDRSLVRRAIVSRRDGLKRPVSKPKSHKHKPPKLIASAKPPKRRPAKVKKTPRKDPPTVSFHADKLSSLMTGKGKDRRRVIIARGGVYLAQRHANSERFLELRCDSAVIFTGQKSASDKSSPEVFGGAGERILGVYLDGDVIISQGDRQLRGPRAYYDFTTDRAIVVGGIMRADQEDRGFAVVVRSAEARMLSRKEYWFRNAKVTTCDFHSPTYHLAVGRAWIKDIAPYDKKGKRIGPTEWEAKLVGTSFNVVGIPIIYWPYTHGNFQVGHTSLRKVQVGSPGRNFGSGVDTEWDLFRLLGVKKPKGFRGRFHLGYFERGTKSGVNLKYSRRNWSGYTNIYGLIDNRGRDDFGDDRRDLSVPNYRGRFTHRHKHFLANHWMIQAEVSWYSDRNFPEAFFPGEFHAGKTQETLLYAKKQRDNWAFTSLLQYRLNRFDTQTESAPDLAFYLLGEPLLQDNLTLFSETRAGMKKWRPDKATRTEAWTDSRLFPRFDARAEIDWPVHWGPVNIVPYAVARGTYWDDQPPGGEQSRPFGQIGARTNMHLWRVYSNADSRMWDIHSLKHVITPEAVVFAGENAGVEPGDLFPMDAGIEQHIRRQSGYSIGIRQRLLTKRGEGKNRKVVDWMRLDVTSGRFYDHCDDMPADGRFFMSRPEYSVERDHINYDYLWNISDSTTILSDANYDTHTGTIGRASVSLNVKRSPRFSYFGSMRYIRELDSSIATAGFSYKLTRKYSMRLFEQYDFDYDSGHNLSTRLTITRKLPRWVLELTVVFSESGRNNNIGVFLTLSPQGMSEVKVESKSILGSSTMN